jgi:ABC-type phosphate transport system auxiliary subunit
MASIEKDWHSCAAYAEGIEQIKNSIYLEKSNPARRDLRKLIRLSEDLNKKYNSFISEQAREKVKAEAEPVEEKIIQLRGELKQSDSDLAILERRLKGKTMHFLDKIHDLEIAFDDLVCKHRLDKEPFSNIEEAKYDDRFTYVLLGIMAFIFFIISCTVHMASE